MLKIKVNHIAKEPTTLTANGWLKTTSEKEIYGFSIEELRQEMAKQDQFHYVSGPFKILYNKQYGEYNNHLDELIEVDDTLFPDMTVDNAWYIMRESKIEEAIRYGGAKFRIYQRQYLRDNYTTSWYAWKE